MGGVERAIRWLIGNLTEDAEMESFVMAIHGSVCEIRRDAARRGRRYQPSANPNECSGDQCDS